MTLSPVRRPEQSLCEPVRCIGVSGSSYVLPILMDGTWRGLLVKEWNSPDADMSQARALVLKCYLSFHPRPEIETRFCRQLRNSLKRKLLQGATQRLNQNSNMQKNEVISALVRGVLLRTRRRGCRPPVRRRSCSKPNLSIVSIQKIHITVSPSSTRTGASRCIRSWMLKLKVSLTAYNCRRTNGLWLGYLCLAPRSRPDTRKSCAPPNANVRLEKEERSMFKKFCLFTL